MTMRIGLTGTCRCSARPAHTPAMTRPSRGRTILGADVSARERSYGRATCSVWTMPPTIDEAPATARGLAQGEVRGGPHGGAVAQEATIAE